MAIGFQGIDSSPMHFPLAYRIGRSPQADIRIAHNELSVSGQHAELVITQQGRFYLTDCGSTNGTFVYRSGTWQRLRQDYVQAVEPIRLGAFETSIAECLKNHPDLITQGIGHAETPALSITPAPLPAQTEAPIQDSSRQAQESKHLRRPRRNPLTGEIIET